jgi:PAS domain S-box-containing protein
MIKKGIIMIDGSFQLIKSLGVCCRYLARTDLSTDALNEVLEVIGTSMRVHGVSLIRKRYLNRDKYIFEFIAQWDSSSDEIIASKETINPQDLPEGWIKTLSNKKPVIVKNSNFSLLGAISNLLLVPVIFKKELYCILSFSDFESSVIDNGKIELGLAIGNIFELWAHKIQADKQVTEILDFIPNPIIMFDNSGAAKVWNKAAELISGWSGEKDHEDEQLNNIIPLNKEDSMLALHPYIVSNRKENDQESESDKKVDKHNNIDFNNNFVDKGVFVASKTEILYDVCNQPYSSINFIEDVTREREIAKNLRRSETMYRTIIDFAGVGIILFRKDRILYYNERLAEFLGITKRIITLTDFMNWIDYSEPRVRKFFNTPYREINNPSTFEFRANHRDEEWRYYKGYGKVIGYEDQPAVHFILDDVTLQKESAKIARMNELRLQHEDRLAALGVMAAGIAHELNQPLNTIRVISDTALFGRDQGWELNEEELFEGLKKISKQVLRMSDVIQSIRNFAREDRGKFENIDPNDAIRNVFSMIGKQFEAHGIQIEMDLETDLPPLRGNMNALEQVIMNLIVNARQALEEHRQFNKKLWIKSGTRFNRLFIEVGDNASGIPDELRMNIFDPFYTTKEPGKGTGLGLSISQSIVTEFQGTLKVYNNDQGGATFFITAPFSGVKL